MPWPSSPPSRQRPPLGLRLLGRRVLGGLLASGFRCGLLGLRVRGGRRGVRLLVEGGGLYLGLGARGYVLEERRLSGGGLDVVGRLALFAARSNTDDSADGGDRGGGRHGESPDRNPSSHTVSFQHARWGDRAGGNRAPDTDLPRAWPREALARWVPLPGSPRGTSGGIRLLLFSSVLLCGVAPLLVRVCRMRGLTGTTPCRTRTHGGNSTLSGKAHRAFGAGDSRKQTRGRAPCG